MGYLTSLGLPIPFGFEGNNVPQHLLTFAQKLADIFAGLTYAQIGALAGTDLWDGRIIFQTDTGAARPWKGLYRYNGATAAWSALAPTGPPANYDPNFTFNGTPPSGTAINEQGQYSRFGSLVLGRTIHLLPASGYVNGSGVLQITLPVEQRDTTPNVAGSAYPIGIAISTDASAGSVNNIFTITSGTDAAPNTKALFRNTTGLIDAASPIVWSNSDELRTLFCYEGVEA